jgi:hypothetical protein
MNGTEQRKEGTKYRRFATPFTRNLASTLMGRRKKKKRRSKKNKGQIEGRGGRGKNATK